MDSVPLAVHVTPGQRHESTCFEQLLRSVRVYQPRGRSRRRPHSLAGDKGYSYPRIRRWLRRHRIQAIIPQKSDELRRHRGRPINFDREIYRQRNVVERCIAWLKENRRIAMRYEKLAINYLGMLKLAILKRYIINAFPNRA